MSRLDVERHAKTYSKSATTGPWKDNFDEMAKKTVIKKVLKYAPMKSEFTRGVVQDETIKNDISEDMYSVPDETIFEADYEVDVNTGEVISNG